jgi:NAD(P)-dependent dehydrogenase (short-subunit alcohol dehydrogenase family)
MNAHGSRKFAVITRGSSGIGYEFAKVCAGENFEVLVIADQGVEEATARLYGLTARLSRASRQTWRRTTATKALPRRSSRVGGPWTYSR